MRRLAEAASRIGAGCARHESLMPPRSCLRLSSLRARQSADGTSVCVLGAQTTKVNKKKSPQSVLIDPGNVV